MNNATTAQQTTGDVPTHEALVDHYIAGMKQIQEQMNDDREEILKLQAETRTILEDVEKTLKTA